MSIVEDISREEEEKVIPLREPSVQVHQGGKGPPGDNWLIRLRTGSVFLSNPITEKNSPFLELWHVVAKSGQNSRYVLLYTNINTEMHSWVDSVIFCQTRELKTIIDGGFKYDVDGSPLRSGELEDNGVPPGITQTDEGKE